MFHEHVPFARIGMWDFSLFLCLHCVLGGLDQGADSTLRDSDVQVLLSVFSFSFWDWVFRTNMRLLYSVWEEPLHLPQGRKEVPNIIFSLYAKCMVCKNGIRTHAHTHTNK